MNSLKSTVRLVLILLGLSFLWAFNRVDVHAAELSSSEINYATSSYSVGYTNTDVNFRVGPGTNYDIINTLEINTAVAYFDNGSDWYTVIFEDQTGFINKKYISDEKTEIPVVEEYTWNGPKLTAFSGTCYGPSGKETYYNMNMSGVVQTLKNKGYSGDYWIRSDGVKMFGSYVMTAARYADHPYGSIIPTSLGLAIICDTGGFATCNSGVALDIAVSW